MKMTNDRIRWRLGKLPTPEEVSLLHKEGILTKDEVREILFSLETSEEREKESLESEVSFLRKLVENLGTKNTIIERITTIEKPYYTQPWFQQYSAWCSSSAQYATTLSTNSAAISTGNSTYTMSSSGSGNTFDVTMPDYPFSAIRTF